MDRYFLVFGEFPDEEFAHIYDYIVIFTHDPEKASLLTEEWAIYYQSKIGGMIVHCTNYIDFDDYDE